MNKSLQNPMQYNVFWYFTYKASNPNSTSANYPKRSNYQQ